MINFNFKSLNKRSRLQFRQKKRFRFWKILCSSPTKIKRSEYVIYEHFRNHLIVMNPSLSLLYVLPKIYRGNLPIRPIVSYIIAPNYHLYRFSSTWFTDNTIFSAHILTTHWLRIQEHITRIIKEENAWKV